MNATLPHKRPSLCSNRSLSHLFNLVFLMAFSLPVLALAQDAAGSLEGRLTDKNGAPVANAAIQLTNIETNAIRSQTSDAEGFYRLIQLAVGHYSLSVDAPGFAHVSRSSIDITVSQTSRIDIPMTLASINESIEVTATTASIDTSARLTTR